MISITKQWWWWWWWWLSKEVFVVVVFGHNQHQSRVVGVNKKRKENNKQNCGNCGCYRKPAIGETCSVKITINETQKKVKSSCSWWYNIRNWIKLATIQWMNQRMRQINELVNERANVKMWSVKREWKEEKWNEMKKIKNGEEAIKKQQSNYYATQQ